MIKIMLAVICIIVLYFFLPGKALALMAYIGAVSLITFAAFGLDKLFAMRGLRRIPEDALLVFSCLGGTPGAFAGQMIFRHKTRKPYINRALIIISIFQIIVIIGYSLAVVKNS